MATMQLCSLHMRIHVQLSSSAELLEMMACGESGAKEQTCEADQASLMHIDLVKG